MPDDSDENQLFLDDFSDHLPEFIFGYLGHGFDHGTPVCTIMNGWGRQRRYHKGHGSSTFHFHGPRLSQPGVLLKHATSQGLSKESRSRRVRARI